MHATPFSNSVAVGTEGVKPLWHALDGVTEAVVLARLVVAGAEPRPERMRRRAAEGFTSATELANLLVRETGMSFRRAHHLVGELVTSASERGEPLDRAAEPFFREHGVAVDASALDSASIAASAAYGGGPAAPSLRRITAELRRGWADAAHRLDARSRSWRDGARALDLAVAGLLADELPSIASREARPESAVR